MSTVIVHLGERSYPILIARGLISRLGREVESLGLGSDPVVVTTRPIARLVGRRVTRALRARGLAPLVIVVPEGERAKSSAVALSVLHRLARWDRTRRPILLAVGGGVIGDLTGFVAAVYKRGIPYVQVPTTLTAQVDSAIGGKTAIDLPEGKNLIGAFYQPRAVYSDLHLLRSLPDREWRSGLAEVVKCGVILDRGLFEDVERHAKELLTRALTPLERVVSRTARLKARIVEQDELDRRGIRMLLNFGHTLGHAIEAACGYDRRYTHGEAVSVGMAAASRLAARLGLMRAMEPLRVERLLVRLGLPIAAPGVPFARVWRAIQHDKKFIGATSRWVLPVGLGRGQVRQGVPGRLVKSVLSEALRD